MTESLRKRALALYRPPFIAGFAGYVFDVNRHVVADNDGSGLRVRGWGRIQYMANPEALQDDVWAIIVESGAAEPGLSPEDVAEKMTKFWEEG